MRKVKMDSYINTADERVWTLHYQYVAALKEAGLQDIPAQRPQISIKNIPRRIWSARLRTRMRYIVEWRIAAGLEYN